MKTAFSSAGILYLLRTLRPHRRGASRTVALAVVADGASRDMLLRVFQDAGRELLLASTTVSAVELQQQRLCPVILFDLQAEQDWQGAVSRLASLTPHPCVILMSPRCDKNLWDEVTRNGGSDVLRTPLVAEDVLRTVESHARIWQCRQKLRGPRSTDQSFPNGV